MSTLSRARIRKVLISSLLPLLTIFYISGAPGLPILLEELGSLFGIVIPPVPWIVAIWDAFWQKVAIPNHIFEFGKILGLVSAGIMFLKVIGVEKAEKFEGGFVANTTEGDWYAIIILMVVMIPVALLIDYPMRPVPVIQATIVIGLKIGFAFVPNILLAFWSGRGMIERFGLLVSGFIIGSGLTVIAVMLMQMVQWCSMGAC